MTNDNLVGWLMEEGYEYDPDTGEWVYEGAGPGKGMTAKERETAIGGYVGDGFVLRDVSGRADGMVAALDKAEGSSRSVEHELKAVYQEVVTGMERELPTISTIEEAKSFTREKLQERLENSLKDSGRGGVIRSKEGTFDMIKALRTKVKEYSGLPDVSKAMEAVKKLQEATKKASVEKLKEARKELRKAVGKGSVTSRILGFETETGRKPKTIIVGGKARVISVPSVYSKAEETAAKNANWRKMGEEVTADSLSKSAVKTVKGFMDYYKFNPDEAGWVENLIASKGMEVYSTKSGQRRFRPLKK